MTSVAVSPCTSAHLEGVLSLYARVFGDSAVAAFRRRYEWSRKKNLYPDETGEWVLVAGGERVVGYLGCLPLPYWAGGRVVAQTSADYMVAPEFAFQGIALMRESFRRFGRQISVDDVEATRAVLKLMKARSVLKLRRYAKPLDARLARARGRLPRQIPAGVLAPSRHILRALDRIRQGAARHRVEPVPFDTRFDRYFERSKARVRATVLRDSAYYRWRYGPGSPQSHAKAFGVLDPEGELRGYVVCCTARDSFHRGYVLEMSALETEDEELHRALLMGALRSFRADGAWVAYCHLPEASPGAAPRALTALGFRPRDHVTELLVRPNGQDSPQTVETLTDAEGWDLQFGDAETTHALVA